MVTFDWFPGLLLLALLPWVWRTGRRLKLSGGRKVCIISGRMILVVALSALVSRAAIQMGDDKVHVVILADRSSSLASDRQAELDRFILEQARRTPVDALLRVISFGAKSVPEGGAAEGPWSYAPPASLDEDLAGGTDLEAALKMAQACLPPAGRRRVVILSDFLETRGEASREIPRLRDSRIGVDSRPVDNGLRGDFIVEDARGRARVGADEPFTVEVPVLVPRDMEGTLVVRVDGEESQRLRLSLPAGHQVLRIREKIRSPGGHRIDATVVLETDARTDNNAAGTYVQVGSKESVLLIGSPAARANLERTLREASLQVEISTEFPQTLAEWNRFGAAVIVDKPALGLTKPGFGALRTWVEELGGGLGMLGSDSTFAPGGYYQTPVEDILPVQMKPRSELRLGDLAMIIVVDQSGSMGAMTGSGQTKMDLANQGAASTLDLMMPGDQLAVSMVDTAVSWVVPLHKIVSEEGKTAARVKVLANRPGGGGILVYTALAAAYEAMRTVKAASRHIILYADGADSEQQNGCQALVSAGLSEGITLTTVSLGQAHDTPFLQAMATLGGGRFYLTQTGEDIKQIFTRETSVAGRRGLIEKPLQSLRHHATTLWEKPEGPALDGYVVTALKPGAEMLLRSNLAYIDEQGQKHEERAMDPILARWQVGLGKSFAFTSDTGGKLSSAFVASEDFRTFWPRALRWSLREGLPDDLLMHVDPSTGQVDLRALSGTLAEGITLRQVGPGGATDVPVEPLSPRHSRAQADLSASGSHVLVAMQGSRPLARANLVIQPGGRELRRAGCDLALAERLSRETSGQVFQGDGDIFRREGPSLEQHSFPLIPLVLLAMCGLILDVCGRRLPWPRGREPHAVQVGMAPQTPRTRQPQTAPPITSVQRTSSPAAKPLPTEKALPPQPSPPSLTDDLLERKRRRGR